MGCTNLRHFISVLDLLAVIVTLRLSLPLVEWVTLTVSVIVTVSVGDGLVVAVFVSVGDASTPENECNDESVADWMPVTEVVAVADGLGVEVGLALNIVVGLWLGLAVFGSGSCCCQ